MSNDLVKIESQSLGLVPSTHEMQVLKVIAEQSAQSGFYRNIGGLPQIMSILLSARELGVMPMQALNGGIWNIQGKIEISARLMCTLIRRAGHSIKVIKCDKTGCILEGKRSDNGDSMQASFSIEDAQIAGLAGRDVWKKYTEDMLYSRALSRLARRLFSDVIGNSYIEGEIRDATSECTVTDVSGNSGQIDSIAENKESIDDEISTFYDSHGEDGHAMRKFVAESCKAQGWTEIEAIRRFIDSNGKGKSAFDSWKSKQAA